MTDDQSDRHDCPYCSQVFARADYRDLHLGVGHEERLTAEQRDAYETALTEEERELRLFRYKALGLLVVVYFSFIILYAFSLA